MILLIFQSSYFLCTCSLCKPIKNNILQVEAIKEFLSDLFLRMYLAQTVLVQRENSTLLATIGIGAQELFKPNTRRFKKLLNLFTDLKLQIYNRTSTIDKLLGAKKGKGNRVYISADGAIIHAEYITPRPWEGVSVQHDQQHLLSSLTRSPAPHKYLTLS